MNQPHSEPWTMTPLAARILDALKSMSRNADETGRMCIYSAGLAMWCKSDEPSVKLELLRLQAHGYVSIMPHDAECSVFDFVLVAKGDGE